MYQAAQEQVRTAPLISDTEKQAASAQCPFRRNYQIFQISFEWKVVDVIYNTHTEKISQTRFTWGWGKKLIGKCVFMGQLKKNCMVHIMESIVENR